MKKTKELIQDLETKLKKEFPNLYYGIQEFPCKESKEPAGFKLRVMGHLCTYMIIDANIATSKEKSNLNNIVLFSKDDEDAKALFEKTKQFYYENKIPFKEY